MLSKHSYGSPGKDQHNASVDTKGEGMRKVKPLLQETECCPSLLLDGRLPVSIPNCVSFSHQNVTSDHNTKNDDIRTENDKDGMIIADCGYTKKEIENDQYRSSSIGSTISPTEQLMKFNGKDQQYTQAGPKEGYIGRVTRSYNLQDLLQEKEGYQPFILNDILPFSDENSSSFIQHNATSVQNAKNSICSENVEAALVNLDGLAPIAETKCNKFWVYQIYFYFVAILSFILCAFLVFNGQTILRGKLLARQN